MKPTITRNVPDWKYWHFINEGWDGIAANTLAYVKDFGEKFYKGKYMIVRFKHTGNKDYYMLYVKKRKPYVRKPYPNPEKYEKDWRNFLNGKGQHPKYLVRKH